MPPIISADIEALQATAAALARYATAAQEQRAAAHQAMELLRSTAWSGQHRLHFESVWEALEPQLNTRCEALAVLSARVAHHAERLEAAGAAFGGAGTPALVSPEMRPILSKLEWSVRQVDGQPPIIELADGTQIDLGAVRAGDEAAQRGLFGFLVRQQLSTVFLQRLNEQRQSGNEVDAGEIAGVLEKIADGKWQHVNGYINSQSGQWVEAYYRRLPGGEAAAKHFGKLVKILEVADLSSSAYAALTDQQKNEWQTWLIGKPGGTDITYSFYEKPHDHWRDVAEKTGEIAGGGIGGWAGGILGTSVGPGGTVVGGIAGGVAGGEAGGARATDAYDAFKPELKKPPRPESQFKASIEGDSLSATYNPDAPSIDINQLAGEGTSTRMDNGLDEQGRPVTVITTTPQF